MSFRSVELILPFPPSVNSLYFQGKTHGQKFLSKKGREYKKMLVDLHSNDDLNPITEPLFVQITIVPPDNRMRDLDNYIKPILDGIKYLEMIEDDSQVQVLLVSKEAPNIKYNKGLVVVKMSDISGLIGFDLEDRLDLEQLENMMSLFDSDDLVHFIKDSKAYQKRIGGL